MKNKFSDKLWKKYHICLMGLPESQSKANKNLFSKFLYSSIHTKNFRQWSDYSYPVRE